MIDLKEGEILVLRTSKPDGSSQNGFVWPRSGPVEAPDWNGLAECGGGLHGLPRGCGDGSLLNWFDAAAAQIVKVNTRNEYYEFEGKCKFRRGEVVFFGSLREAIDILCQHYPDAAIVGKTATADNFGTATAGYRGTATAGDGGIATAGYGGTATAGSYGTATAGSYGTATAGDGGTATAGCAGTATAGNGGTATAGYRGTATAGNGGTATADNFGTATAGYGGTATAGNGGTATADDGGTIIIKRWDGKRWKYSIGYVGEEDGLKPNTLYKLDDEGNFVEKGG